MSHLIGRLFRGTPKPKPTPVPTPKPEPTPTPVTDGMKLKWIEIAKTQLGVKEIAGSRANPDIVKYHKTTGGWSSDEVAWCASFISWVLIQCGLHKARARNINWALAISWLKYGTKCDLKVGAIVVIKTSIGGNHVTFCVGFDGDYFLGLGGNQANACNIKRYPRSSVVGCRWPS